MPPNRCVSTSAINDEAEKQRKMVYDRAFDSYGHDLKDLKMEDALPSDTAASFETQKYVYLFHFFASE